MLPKGNLIRRIYRKLDHKFYKRHIDYIKQLAVKESFKYSSWVEDIKINIFSTLMYKPRQKRNITGATKTNMANNNYLEAQMKHQLKRRRLVIKRLNFVSSLKHCKCWTFSFLFSTVNSIPLWIADDAVSIRHLHGDWQTNSLLKLNSSFGFIMFLSKTIESPFAKTPPDKPNHTTTTTTHALICITVM